MRAAQNPAHSAMAILDHLAWVLVRAAGFTAPPVCMFEVANAAGIPVREMPKDRYPDAYGYSLGSRAAPFVLLRHDLTALEQQFVLGHELGEIMRVEYRQMMGRYLTPQLIEHCCHCLSEAILLPTRWFKEDCRRLDFNLVRLRRIYSTATVEAIVKRWLFVSDAPTICTIMSNGNVVWRRSNGPRCNRWHVIERLAINRVIATGQHCHWKGGSGRHRVHVDAWPTEDLGQQRIAIRTSWKAVAA